ncbi:MAG: hypothetical protein V1848_04020 [Candidatus Magasanikbacteria bacterium]
MKTILELFNTILTADIDTSRKASREVRKLIYSSHNGQYSDILSIIKNAPEKYEKIEEDFRKNNFVMAISVIYFLHDREDHPDFLFPWIFNLLQHENGNIRFAAVRMLEHELGPLTYHIRLPNEKLNNRELSPEQADIILYNLFINLHILSTNLWKPSYKKFKYISSLPTGPFKSVQMILSQLDEYCDDNFMNRCTKAYTIRPTKATKTL